VKAERAQVTSLSQVQAREILAVPWDDPQPVSSEATVYAGLVSREPAATGTVAVSLVAGLLGHRQTVATAGIPPGFSGLAVVATGIVADSWHVEAMGGGSDISLQVALGIRQCCSGFGVFVPPELQSNIPTPPGEDFPARVQPIGREHGAYRGVTAANTAISVSLDEGDRVLRAEVDTSGGVAVSLSFASFSWLIPADDRREISPAGNLQGPATLTTGGATVAYYMFELVR
jgi:hypothetical protein